MLYPRALLDLGRRAPFRAAAHITGGGISENLPRALPPGCAALIDAASWEWPAVFRWLQDEGRIETGEMHRTFNCGVGMFLAVEPSHVEAAIAALAEHDLSAWVAGEVTRGDGTVTIA